MIFFNQTIVFKIKSLQESLDDIDKRISFSTNNYEIKVLNDFLQRVKEKSTSQLMSKYDLLTIKAKNYIKKFEEFWKGNRLLILTEIEKIFDFNHDGDRQFVCFLGVEPLPHFDYYNRMLTLPMQADFNTNLTTIMSFLFKAVILSKLYDTDVGRVDLSYSKYSLRWIMADFVADAIVYNTQLKQVNIWPAYKYFYNIEVDGVKLVDKFRAEFNSKPIKEFSEDVLKCVRDNYEVFRNFSNRY